MENREPNIREVMIEIGELVFKPFRPYIVSFIEVMIRLLEKVTNDRYNQG